MKQVNSLKRWKVLLYLIVLVQPRLCTAAVTSHLLHHGGLVGIHFGFLRLRAIVGSTAGFHYFRLLPY